jgi:hypothetical protein
VNDADSTSQGEVELPEHLVPALHAAAVLEVEMACDGEWGEDVHLERVVAAVHALDAVEVGACSQEQVIALALRAIAMEGEVLRAAVELGEPYWPTTLQEADVLGDRAHLTRELIELRDAVGGSASSGAEPDEAPDG